VETIVADFGDYFGDCSRQWGQGLRATTWYAMGFTRQPLPVRRAYSAPPHTIRYDSYDDFSVRWKTDRKLPV